MAHKFKVGQLVEYIPIGGKVSLYKILRLLAEEFAATDWKYRIKSDQEGYRADRARMYLSPAIVPETLYEEVKPLRRVGRHH